MNVLCEWTFLDEFVRGKIWGLRDEVLGGRKNFFYCNLEVSQWEMILEKGEKIYYA